jgi:Inositol 1,3,4-trisphosphate 5/6-kinase pre-ATP-grasp domain
MVVGYAFMAKKKGRMGKVLAQEESRPPETMANGGNRVGAAATGSIVFKALDLERELEEQGHFDVLLHKLSEDIMYR